MTATFTYTLVLGILYLLINLYQDAPDFPDPSRWSGYGTRVDYQDKIPNKTGSSQFGNAQNQMRNSMSRSLNLSQEKNERYPK